LPSAPDSAEAGNAAAFLGSDGEAHQLEALLSGKGIAFFRHTPTSLCASIADGSLDILLVSGDALTAEIVGEIGASLAGQPLWSDLPILLLVDRDRMESLPNLAELGQVRIVELPLDHAILTWAVCAALRSRSLQRRGEVFLKQHKATADMLRESEMLYRHTIELSQQLVWTSDEDGHVRGIGDRFYRLTNTNPATPIEDLLPLLIHPDDYAPINADWMRAQQRGELAFFEFRMRVADGSYRTFQARNAPLRDETGRILRWYGCATDVTEEKQASLALALAEERYRFAARATNDAIWDWDLATDRVAWSDAAATYFGNQPLEDSTIQSWEEAIHPDDRQRVVRSIYGAISSDKPRWSAAYRLRKADGDYAYVYDRGFIIRDEEGKAMRAVGAVVDLTERRRAEAELRRTQAELIHVSRVSAMGTMASTLAHELNQPLTAVTSYVRGCRRLLAGLDDPEAQQVVEALEYAEAGALRAGQIVRRLRELVSRGTVKVGAEDLTRLVEDASVVAFVDERQHGITHRITIDPDARWVEVDRIQIQQVLINLIRNAVQSLQHVENREVRITAHATSDDMVEVRVADSGGGISGTVRDALFSPFQSTKSDGMGIGLSISRTIVEAHHGKIWAEDGPDGGAIFHFTLPRAEMPPEDLSDGNHMVMESAAPFDPSH
jgi:two-component system sensor kinase FixL